jgi:hypothetical protein
MQGESQNFEVGDDLKSVTEANESHQKEHKIVEKVTNYLKLN